MPEFATAAGPSQEDPGPTARDIDRRIDALLEGASVLPAPLVRRGADAAARWLQAGRSSASSAGSDASIEVSSVVLSAVLPPFLALYDQVCREHARSPEPIPSGGDEARHYCIRCTVYLDDLLLPTAWPCATGRLIEAVQARLDEAL